MMKKKMKHQEEAIQDYFDNTTENKENAINSDSNNMENPEISDSGGSTPQSSDDSATESGASDKVVPEVKAVEEKLAEMQDKYIRLSAEFDNYRKRTLREKMELSKYASENMLISIIPLMDDFERALKHMDTTTDCAGIKDGIDIIYGKFSEFLKQYGIKEIEALNSDFNVDLHEAVANVPVSEDEKKGKVVDVILKGYYLQDKVLRFAKVVVGV
ncbi:MAG TPA: nucleotide exchange factor GrpE [Bacteroidales bacterium]